MEWGSMTMALLVVSLLALMAAVVRSYTNAENTEAEISDIIKNMKPNEILGDFKRQLFTLRICAAAGMALTFMFAMAFYSGGTLNPATWDSASWMAVSVGALVVFGITAVQYNLYQDINGSPVAFAITVGILVFVYYSEIATTAEREEQKMHTASLESPTFKAMLGAIGQNNAAMAGPSGYESMIAEAASKKAHHEQELKRCNRHKSKGAKRVERCVNYESKKISGYQAEIDTYSVSASNRSVSLQHATVQIGEKAKAMEKDERNHSAMVKWIMSFFGVVASSAVVFAAFLLVQAFELGFHYSGSRVGHLRAALARLGFSDQRDKNNFEIVKGQQDLLKLRDAAKTTKEMKVLKEKIKVATGGENRPTPNYAPANAVSVSETVSNHIPTVSDTVKRPTPNYSSANFVGFVDTDQTVSTNVSNRIPPTVSNRTDTVDTVKKDTVSDTVVPIKTTPNARLLSDDLYTRLKSSVLKEELRPSVRQHKLVLLKWKKEGDKDVIHLTNDPKRQKASVKALDRMLEEGVVVLNPDWVSSASGVDKYLLAKNAKAA